MRVGIGVGADWGGGTANADLLETDCERERIEGSDALRLLEEVPWLLDERWPGVWLRVGAAARSWASFPLSPSPSAEDGAIFWDRMVLDLLLEGDRGLSAIVSLAEGMVLE